ncbi:MAG: hypothetical protein K8T89_18475 [Planctomycetes bacterium]|nr:hypothetical protein [Planctomycetota bacterium]
MSHSHAHAEANEENTYFLDQLCTIAVCGLLGFTAIGLYLKGWLTAKFGLIERFHVPVFAGGITLLVLVVLRSLAIWRMAGQARAAHTHSEEKPVPKKEEHSHGHEHSHDHEHSHGHEHSHSHGHEHAHASSHGHEHAPKHNHSHGDDAHDHGWAPWQYAILIIPAVLYFLELPRDGYNMTRLDADLKDVELDPGTASKRIAFASAAGSMVLPAFKKTGQLNLKFSELSRVAATQRSRERLEGYTVVLEGHFRMIPGKDKEFQLFRVMVNCCGTDSITLKSRIVAPEALQGYAYMDWVKIEGELSFQKVGGKDEWMPVITLPSMANIQKVPPPADPNKDV